MIIKLQVMFSASEVQYNIQEKMNIKYTSAGVGSK